jgi:hypothetical protein
MHHLQFKRWRVKLISSEVEMNDIELALGANGMSASSMKRKPSYNSRLYGEISQTYAALVRTKETIPWAGH